ncbi:MAG: hypothetical protein M1826_007543 [Phylliscum demangeonii]|nr:MAG: hypothetical protein M1826_007543 [Phylliscum demangeonii]
MAIQDQLHFLNIVCKLNILEQTLPLRTNDFHSPTYVDQRTYFSALDRWLRTGPLLQEKMGQGVTGALDLPFMCELGGFNLPPQFLIQVEMDGVPLVTGVRRAA